MSGKAVEDYSTNPSTVKARRRKMNLSGAKKVEDAARTADYKAMYYARKVIQAKPSFQAALYADKVSMLERAMRETMEKRYDLTFSLCTSIRLVFTNLFSQTCQGPGHHVEAGGLPR